MSGRNDGGQAFPTHPPAITNMDRRIHGAIGMTLRDYFIAHAPAEPQPWFEPVFGPPPAKPEYPQNRTELENQELNGLGDYIDDEELTQPRVKAYAEAAKAHHIALRHWVKAHERERYVQWPAAWADAMLAARETP